MRRRLLRSVKIVLANILAVSVSLVLFSDVIAFAYTVNVTTWNSDTEQQDDSVGHAEADIDNPGPGNEVTITATAENGYHFDRWDFSSDQVSINDPNSRVAIFSMINNTNPENLYVYAYFGADAPAPDPAPAPVADPEPEPENNEPEYVPDTDPLTPQNDNGQTEEPQVTEPDPFEGFQQDTVKALDDVILNQAGFTSYAPGVHIGVQNYTNSQIKIDSGNCVSFKSDVYQKIDEVLAAGIPIQLNYVYDNQQSIIVLPPNLPFKLASICDSTGYCGFETLKLYLFEGGYIMPVYEVLGYKSTSETNATPTPTSTSYPKLRLDNAVNKVVDLSSVNLSRGVASKVSENAVPVTMTANKEALKSSVSDNIALYAKVDITFKKGAEGSTVTTMKDGASAKVENKTHGAIELKSKIGSATMEPGDKGTVKDARNDKYENGADGADGADGEVMPKGTTERGNSVIYGYIPENSIYQLWYVPTNPAAWPIEAQSATN